MLLSLPICPWVGGAELWQRIQAVRSDGSYADATAQQRLETRRLFGDLVAWAAAGSIPDGVEVRARSLGLTMERAGDVVVLSPRGEGSRADGVFAVRIGTDVPNLILQAPHSWSDMYTGQLGATLFEDGLARAAFFNNAHRNSPSAGDLAPRGSTGTSDLAHRPFSIFQAATLGAVDGLDAPLVVQIHGFGSSHGSFSAVVSRGASWQPAVELARAMELLEAVLTSFGPVTDGDIVPELAGVTNAQGRAIAMQARFLHLELCHDARIAMIDDTALRAQFGDALVTLAEKGP